VQAAIADAIARILKVKAAGILTLPDEALGLAETRRHLYAG
jgi:hypothetical protein